MIVIKKKFLDKIIWSIFLFILFFYPPIIPHINLFLAFISLIAILVKYSSKAKIIMGKSKMNLWSFSIIFLFLYVFTIPFAVSWFMNDIVNLSHYISLINRFAVLFVTIVPSCIFLLCMLDKKEYDYHFFIQIVINAGLIESFLVMLSFLFPAVKALFISLMARNTTSDLYENMWYITVRAYGLAGTLVDLFGLGIAVIAGISFFYGIVYKQRYIVYSIFIISSALLNARTGVVVYIISVAFAIIYIFHQRNAKPIFKTIIAILIVFIMSIGLFRIISKNGNTMWWLQTLIDSIVNTIKNQSAQGAVKSLLSESFWELPDVFRTVIGTAHSKYLAQGYSHSDVGYINDIWFSGIIGCVILYGCLIRLDINIYKKSENILLKLTSLHILLCFFVFNFKAAAYGYNPGAAVILTLVFALNYYVGISKKE